MKKRSRLLILSLLFLLALTGLYYYEQVYRNTPVTYPGFGITVPAGYTTHGIDVSRYQRRINWDEVVKMRDQGQQISFAIIKATEGANLKDAFFERNWEESRERNLLRGAYLYFHPRIDPQKQAQLFIKTVSLEEGDLPPVVDIEERNRMDKTAIQGSLRRCLEALEKKYGRKPIIYTGADFYEQYLGEAFDEYPLWVAHYEEPLAPRIGRPWIMWQHNCRGNVNGIRGDVDFNVVNGSLASLRELCL